MTQDNSLLAALAISAVNNGEQTSAHLPRNAEKKNILSAVIILRLNDHHIWKKPVSNAGVHVLMQRLWPWRVFDEN